MPLEAITLYAYAATQVIAEGIAKAGSADTRKVADYLHPERKFQPCLDRYPTIKRATSSSRASSSSNGKR